MRIVHSAEDRAEEAARPPHRGRPVGERPCPGQPAHAEFVLRAQPLKVEALKAASPAALSNKATMPLPPPTELIPVEVVADVSLNDTNRSVGGRNLYIQNLTLDSQSYAAENATSTASAG